LDGDWGPIFLLYKPHPRSVSTVKATYTTIQKREKSLITTILSTNMAQANNITELSREAKKEILCRYHTEGICRYQDNPENVSIQVLIFKIFFETIIKYKLAFCSCF